MNRLAATVRITIGLVCLTISVLLTAQTLGLIPDRHGAIVHGRKAICEAIAVNCSLLASQGDTKRMEKALQFIAGRNDDILSAAVRHRDGQLLIEVGEHQIHWPGRSAKAHGDAHVYVPINAGDQPWGTVEVRFQPLTRAGFVGWLQRPLTRLALFIGAACFLVHMIYLRRMLQHMDPSQVIPGRVRSAFDTLAEGLLVLDTEERIALANQAFADIVGEPVDQLQGRRIGGFPWKSSVDQSILETFPWNEAIKCGSRQMGDILDLETDESTSRTFKVNVSPIVADDGANRGVLVSFDDVTKLEEKKTELRKMLAELTQSRDQIQRQNKELHLLATQDPLTGCVNRRSLFEKFESQWKAADRYGHQLSCVMLDIDHFKSVNDQHGHSVGDLVLKRVGTELKNAVRDGDVVCRYGGEEFCILLPHLGIEDAARAAERFRIVVEALTFPNLEVTASFGVSAMSLGADHPQEMIDQADKCLYVAKRNGRNQVARWDEFPDDVEIDESASSRTLPPATVDPDVSIPFHAVTALISALGYRHADTAEHSRRVADLCVMSAHGLMSVRDSYVLEISALLHDIGKIGVPDHILLKPGPLTAEEWKVMGIHDRTGIEIVRSAFNCDALSSVIETHHAFFDGNGRHEELPSGEDIPLGARLLSIADAYDAIVSDRVYRKGRTQEEAFAELRRCAGTQFDPQLVERFITAVLARDQSRAKSLPDVSKETALRIGLQIERLACALDDRDIDGLGALAGRLKMTATIDGVPEIAEIAAAVVDCIADDPDLMSLVELTKELLDVCRSTQTAYLDQHHDTHVRTQRSEDSEKVGEPLTSAI